jgi:hypothetical protein
MATTITATTAHLKTTLDVIPKYEALVQSSFGVEGTFIRAKENILAMFEEYSINSNDKASIISNILGSLTSSLANTSMQVALQWATEERTLAFNKERLALEIDLADKDRDLKLAQIKKLKFEAHAIQSESMRTHGTRVFDLADDWVVTMLGDNGKVFKDMELTDTQIIKTHKDIEAIESQIVASKATVHKIVAETYSNYGSYCYAFDNEGAIYIDQSHWEDSLSYIQSAIAKEQAKGYVYNAWGNAVTASAGLLGTAIASDGTIDDLTGLLTIFRQAVGQLKDTEAPFTP